MKQEITIPKGTEKISIEQFDNRIVIELIPKFEPKEGDVLVNNANIIYIFDHVGKNGECYYKAFFDPDRKVGMDLSGNNKKFVGFLNSSRYATDSEKQKIFDILTKFAKLFNAEKKCIEDLPKEPKIGQLCIFWDFVHKYSMVRTFSHKTDDGRYVDEFGERWLNCIPYESEEQYLEHIKQ
ncbi:hypothetical protein [Petrimonas sulfuriphila]|uniref:hypothetical protein n=1 Tax=Petrimonas sulfuriphila TaxID=285070 RepID=UPI003EBC2A20